VLLLVLAGLRMVPRLFTRATGPLLLLAAIFLGVASIRDQALQTKHHELLGEDVWWLDDDMMISLRYAWNFAAGDGLVWNVGEKVEGISNPLWTLLLVVPHWLTSPNLVSLWVIVLNAILFVVLLLLTYRLTRALGGDGLVAGLAALALSTYAAAVHWAVAGGETVLLSILLVGMALALIEPRTARGLFVAAILGGLAFWTRMDAAIVVGVLSVLAGLARGTAPPRSEWMKAFFVLLAFPALLTVLRLFYYGELLPNTYYLKATGWDGRTISGLHYVARLLGQHGLLLGLAVAAILRRRRALPILLAIVAQLAYLVYIGGDELPRQRFFVAIAPLLFATAFLGAQQIAERVAEALAGGESPRPVLVLPLLALGVAGLGAATYPGLVSPESEIRRRSEQANCYLGLMIRENTDEDASAAHFWAGATAYFSERRGIDFLGKCDRHVARLDGAHGLIRPGHNKFDFHYSLGLEPDVIVSAIPGYAGAAQIDAIRKGPYRVFTELYEEPEFQRLYQPLVGNDSSAPPSLQEASLSHHAVFVRAGSPRVRPPGQWIEPKD
jgi:arabinofuranosyltransferase